MTYTIEDFARDHNTDPTKVEAAKARMLEEMRIYELKEARKAQALTQKQLAKQMGVSQKRVSIIESGDVDHVMVSTLKKYLNGIGGSLSITAKLPSGETLELA
ncbi:MULTISPECIES: helix-turn-helix domain-containing protein [Bifidobacterium]|uniref:XRE family transcriptional regulator n=2 Tax=Bifidobacterium TaxID=1678 RepID=A0A261FRS8_9BIFI|nr:MULTISPECIES: helix-turn-helix transcriptional regulator [Bifidobacterium]OZG61892.1 XRE family transcriptional regulator [Bifidobacterium lemurum]OZG69530.1 XRE family transcriptional regulator [Bifidobacterium eulemuris]QOL32077.1 helix-turn-helix transcriptional regulator [Bifidobacterium eulemuris]QOL33314.1 helix-turn-helix transcriptional regulator [Bifidobacterium lemurum]